LLPRTFRVSIFITTNCGIGTHDGHMTLGFYSSPSHRPCRPERPRSRPGRHIQLLKQSVLYKGCTHLPSLCLLLLLLNNCCLALCSSTSSHLHFTARLAHHPALSSRSELVFTLGPSYLQNSPSLFDLGTLLRPSRVISAYSYTLESLAHHAATTRVPLPQP
jgi:hypothetical protein